MEVRHAHLGDALGIATVHARSWQEAFRGFVPQAFLDGLDPAWRFSIWERTLSGQDERKRTLVAVEAGDVVGFAYVRPSQDGMVPSTIGELDSIYLLLESWSKGFGRQLMSSALSDLRELGFSQATLWALDGNQRACRFYEAVGWSTDGGAKDDDALGFALRMVRYRLALT